MSGLPEFNSMERCPKCDCMNFTPKFQPYGLSYGYEKEKYPEHILWTCERCGYKEKTKCKDAE